MQVVTNSSLVRDDELRGRTGADFRRLLHNLPNFREPRSAFECSAKLLQLLHRSAGQDFHAAVAKIAHVSAEVQLLGGILRKVAKAYPLYGAGNEIATETRGLLESSEIAGVLEAAWGVR
jgi:hypothetical protein